MAVDTTGRVDLGSLRIVRSTNPGFDEAAKEAALKTVYRPGRIDGKPSRMYVHLPVRFQLSSILSWR